ncbi:hypothetical protein AVEN_248832-1 [Araneus ventricosus]|uniref:Uncharacterized protein n=1 Tax=Araneus ventricosus TaxID=182803 RepID=A0A4Y2HWW9_ARAVE|nr:hypothetical protein AVEN_248832-1 [Araneus ventricosus]
MESCITLEAFGRITLFKTVGGEELLVLLSLLLAPNITDMESCISLEAFGRITLFKTVGGEELLVLLSLLLPPNITDRENCFALEAFGRITRNRLLYRKRYEVSSNR